MPNSNVTMNELIEAFHFVDVSGFGENQAFIGKTTGRILFVSEDGDLDETAELGDAFDPDDYHEMPNKRDLDLGARLAMAFVAEQLPSALDRAHEIFSRKGAYGRFKQMLADAGVLETWYAYEEQATQAALRAWCEAVGLTVVETGQTSSGREG
jgi:hypothetical protein